MSEITNEVLQQEMPQQLNFRIGTVADLFEDGTAQIQFDGEETPSQKQYAFLSVYKPAASDRVVLAALGGTYIILGKITIIPQSAAGEFTDINVTGDATLANLNVSGNTTLGYLDASVADFNGMVSIAGLAAMLANMQVAGTSTLTGAVSCKSSLDVVGSANVDGALSVGKTATFLSNLQTASQSKLGFYGKTPIAQPQISRATSTTNLENKINEILLALHNFGLVHSPY